MDRQMVEQKADNLICETLDEAIKELIELRETIIEADRRKAGEEMFPEGDARSRPSQKDIRHTTLYHRRLETIKPKSHSAMTFLDRSSSFRREYTRGLKLDKSESKEAFSASGNLDAMKPEPSETSAFPGKMESVKIESLDTLTSPEDLFKPESPDVVILDIIRPEIPLIVISSDNSSNNSFDNLSDLLETEKTVTSEEINYTGCMNTVKYGHQVDQQKKRLNSIQIISETLEQTCSNLQEIQQLMHLWEDTYEASSSHEGLASIPEAYTLHKDRRLTKELVSNLMRTLIMRLVMRLARRHLESLQVNTIYKIIKRLSNKALMEISFPADVLQRIDKMECVIEAIIKDIGKEFSTQKKLMKALRSSNDHCFDNVILKHVQNHLNLGTDALPKKSKICRFF